MSDPMDTQSSNRSPNAQPQNGYATQPNAFRPISPTSPAMPATGTYGTASQPSGGWAMKPYILGAVVTSLVLVLVYQQTQISRLSKDLGQVNDNLKSSDVRDRLDSHERKLEELNTRLTYLDSKVSATDGKAQAALAKLKAQEDNDFFGNAIKNLKHTFGLQ
jgi:hypothetical protein